MPLEPGDPNLKALLRIKITHCMPSQHKLCCPNLSWAFIKRHILTPRSKVRGQIVRALKFMVDKILFQPSLTVVEILCLVTFPSRRSMFGGAALLEVASLDSQS